MQTIEWLVFLFEETYFAAKSNEIESIVLAKDYAIDDNIYCLDNALQLCNPKEYEFIVFFKNNKAENIGLLCEHIDWLTLNQTDIQEFSLPLIMQSALLQKVYLLYNETIIFSAKAKNFIQYLKELRYGTS